MLDLIIKKRQGLELNKDEIYNIVLGYTNKEIPDYQMSSFLMCVYFNGMTEEETYYFTKAIIDSGSVIKFNDLDVFDKHSTGGVGDKVSLILIPLLHSLGFTIAKMSGRGLGHTGGTVDKLESIKGFRVDLGFNEFLSQVKSHNIALISQSNDLCQADKLIYALRDVTGTVESIPLIAASIMSKKIASGANNILIDLKVGSGAFMKDLQEANLLAKYMLGIAKKSNINLTICLSDMSEPLGQYVGNISEVLEALAFFKGKSDQELKDLIYKMTSSLLISKHNISSDLAYSMIDKVINTKAAYNSFSLLLKLQGADIKFLEDFNLETSVSGICYIKAKEDGYLVRYDTESIGNALKYLGGGREKLGDTIDYYVSIKCHHHLREYVKKDEVLFTIYHNDKNLDKAIHLLNNSYTISQNNLSIEPIFSILTDL